MDLLDQTIVGVTQGFASSNNKLPTEIQGQIGGALKFNGKKQYVSFGDQSMNCFANPDECRDGVTMAFWLKRYKDDGKTSIFDSGKAVRYT